MRRQEYGPGLHGRFAEQHTWRDWEMRIVPGIKVFAAGEPLATNDSRVGPRDDLVDQQERLSMRDRGMDFGERQRLYPLPKNHLKLRTVAAQPARPIERVSGMCLGQTTTQFCALPHT